MNANPGGRPEAMMALCINPVQGPNKNGSVGMPLPDVDIRIYDADEGTRILPAREVGEITFSAPQLMVGYWNRPDETAGVLRDHVDEGGTRRWLHTGDLGYLDEDGYLFIVDRKKEIIIRGGENISAAEVEAECYACPAVAEVAVFAAPDERLGEVPVAIIYLKHGESLTEANLRHFLDGRLAKFKIPERIVMADEPLPRLGTGKIDRRALKAQYAH